MTKKDKPNIYIAEEQPLEFISSGCQLLDKVLGGGYPIGRIVNVVGNKAVGKSLLMIEACANFVIKYPNGRIWYHESEAAFDKSYAETLGLPIDKVIFEDSDTIGGLFTSLQEKTKLCSNEPGIYIIDSLDAFTDEAEKKKGIDDGSYGMNKAKQLSELFRRLIRDVKKSKILIMIVSQIRDKIGVSFGEKQTRAGGHALDFYASQIIWLSEIEKIKKTVKNITRPVGVTIKVKCKKNKVGMPFRECEFPIIFNYGIDDMLANLEWLKTINMLESMDISPRMLEQTAKRADTDAELKAKIKNQVDISWAEIENEFLPKSSKYKTVEEIVTTSKHKLKPVDFDANLIRDHLQGKDE